MNTLDELLKYGLPEHTASRMLASYAEHIGEMHGCNKVTDITYIGNGEREIELTCTLCGAKYKKVFNNNGNKWSELRKTCSCQKDVKTPSGKEVTVRNDDPSYIGQVYGCHEVVDFIYIPHRGKSGNTIYWKCRCIHCGKETTKMPSEARKGKKCQCVIQAEWDAERARQRSEEIGKKYGRLTIADLEYRKEKRGTKVYAVCNCDCGGHITAQLINVKIGKTKSCGCIQEEFIRKAVGNRSCARSRSPLYGTWNGMRGRCLNEKNRAYKNYGGRGIKICDEWLGKDGFDNFEKWAFDNGYVPESGLSIDRIDVNGNYEPSNCRWTTVYIQQVNKRKAKRRPVKTYDINGEEKTLNQWCRIYNISAQAVKYRINTLGMDLETALKTPRTRKGNIFAGQQAKERVKDINKCNSYIEANLYLAFIRTTSRYELIPQYQIGQYRVDFIVGGTNILIECDGYDHHKTKDQMAYDCQRERDFVRDGYVVIRFTGTEINTDHDRCCKEIIDIIEALYESRQTNAG